MGSDGKFHALKDYRGRTVVLAWFPKAFTGAEPLSVNHFGKVKALESHEIALFMASTDEHEILKSSLRLIERSFQS